MEQLTIDDCIAQIKATEQLVKNQFEMHRAVEDDQQSSLVYEIRKAQHAIDMCLKEVKALQDAVDKIQRLTR